jgi:hypothetical protein
MTPQDRQLFDSLSQLTSLRTLTLDAQRIPAQVLVAFGKLPALSTLKLQLGAYNIPHDWSLLAASEKPVLAHFRR